MAKTKAKPRSKVRKKKVKAVIDFTKFTKAWDQWVTATKRGLSRSKKMRKPKRSKENERWMTFAWVVPAVVGVLAVGLLIKPKTQYPVALTSPKIVGMFEKVKGQKFEERIAFWSERLLKKPDLLSVLGNGPEVNDTAPLFPHGYDCTTYVETVGALARSNGGSDIADQLISIRYHNGDISFESRNHFPEADWIPNNQAAGILKDITLSVARKSGFVAGFAYKEIDKVAWLKSQRNEHATRAIASLNKEPVSVKLPYIPLDRLNTSLQHIPQGAILNIVRENKKNQPVLITHQGFLIWKNGVAYFRHASRNKQITEMPLSRYLENTKRMPWRVLGVNINTFES